jgi:lipopolysaccharide export system permease protein
MKIFFRYLFMRLLVPFCYCFAAFTILWVMADLYNTMENFIDHHIGIGRILYFYALQIPNMMVQVLPAAVLFSTLFTLLSLNRRSELVALLSGGLAPIWMLAPFLLFGFLAALVLFYDMSAPSARAKVARDHIMDEMRGAAGKGNTFLNLPYIDEANHCIWYFQALAVTSDGGKADGLMIQEQDAEGHNTVAYAAKLGRWTGQFWRLSGVKKIVYNVDGLVQSQEIFPQYDLTDVTTPPKQLLLVSSEPDALTVSELSQYISTSTGTAEHVAKYRTEWWYRVVYPFSILVLMLFALVQGGRSHRRGSAAGIGACILVLVCFNIFNGVFKSAGTYNRLPPFVAVSFVEVVFALIGLHWLALNNGWYWQLQQTWLAWKKKLKAATPADIGAA